MATDWMTICCNGGTPVGAVVWVAGRVERLDRGVETVGDLAEQ